LMSKSHQKVLWEKLNCAQLTFCDCNCIRSNCVTAWKKYRKIAREIKSMGFKFVSLMIPAIGSWIRLQLDAWNHSCVPVVVHSYFQSGLSHYTCIQDQTTYP
jgi:hypothetical protein